MNSNNIDKWNISDEEKQHYIDILTEELPLLRARAGIPQDDLARVIGFTRQTYSSVERRIRPMSWNIYLALVFFFDTNSATRGELRSKGAYPSEIIGRLNNGTATDEELLASAVGCNSDIFGKLDEKAVHTLKTVFIAEYARCTGIPIESAVKMFSSGEHVPPVKK